MVVMVVAMVVVVLLLLRGEGMFMSGLIIIGRSNRRAGRDATKPHNHHHL